MRIPILLIPCLLLAAIIAPAADGPYFQLEYPGSDQPGELQFGVTYTIWIPPGAAKLRGVIVHQHGCGPGAARGGRSAAYDLHWQALARKWDMALLGPYYHQEVDEQDCRICICSTPVTRRRPLAPAGRSPMRLRATTSSAMPLFAIRPHACAPT